MAECPRLEDLLGRWAVGHLTGFRRQSLFASMTATSISDLAGTLSLSFNMPGDEEATERKLREVSSSG